VSPAAKGLAVSVQVRLVRHAKEIGSDPNVVLSRFAVERLLYRLSRSKHADRFVLKGALLMLVWAGETVRPTRDADLLGSGDISTESLVGIFTEVCSVETEPDGLTFDSSSIRVAPIRPEDAYGGLRVTMKARLGNARLPIQVDVGIGDALVPEPEVLDYPTLLDFPRPRLRAYRRETSIAEKLHAIVSLGEINSRMRDYFDIRALARVYPFGTGLVDAVRATFERRRTALPQGLPVGLTPRFAGLKQPQWRGFVQRSGITSAPADFREVVTEVAEFLVPVIEAARAADPLRRSWQPGGPWQ